MFFLIKKYVQNNKFLSYQVLAKNIVLYPIFIFNKPLIY